ncbi:hypothetical protein F2P81_002462 [Scophthalmus maximus]|uniref:Ig-like domain-containing protein n=1 Tax=Scophthalmus maximus TaxID=52904 RepID=A0A6A4TIU5_SCOMX|nr:hypothetical protein F2P81_002462 [Scophthalmus maximus]
MLSRPLSWRRKPRLGVTPLWSFTVLTASTRVRLTSEYVSAIVELSDLIIDRHLILHHWDWLYWKTQQGKKFKKALSVVHGFTSEVVQKCSDLISQQTGAEIDFTTAPQRRKDFLDLILLSKSRGSSQRTEEREENDVAEGDHVGGAAGCCDRTVRFNVTQPETCVRAEAARSGLRREKRTMWQRGTMLAALLAAVTGQSDMLVHKKEGDDVVLKPGSGFPVSDPISSVMWRVGPDIAIQWEASDPDVTYYRHFKASVPVPTVTTSCDEKAGCTLTCEGNTTGAEPVAYKWKSDDTELKPTSKDHHVKKENSPGIKEFSCELVNPVSRESSRPIPNPFIADMPRNLNINTGLAVFLCLLVAVLLLVFIHRGTSGVWFFQKALNSE